MVVVLALVGPEVAPSTGNAYQGRRRWCVYESCAACHEVVSRTLTVGEPPTLAAIPPTQTVVAVGLIPLHAGP